MGGMKNLRLLQILILAVALVVGVTAPVFNGQSILALLIAGSVFLVKPRFRRAVLRVVK